MYKKATFFGFFALCFCALSLFCYFFISLQKVKIEPIPSYDIQSPQLHFVQNTKVFYSFDEGEYKQACFQSEDSLIKRKEGKWEEYLTNLTGAIQTKLYTTKTTNTPMQQVYSFSSKTGKYNYKTNQLITPICKFHFFFANGNVLPQTIPLENEIFLQGSAKWTVFSIKPQLKFAADRLKMVIHRDNEQRKIK